MLESIGKNIWLILTIVIPRMATYGAWRILLILLPNNKIALSSLQQIDNSAILSACVVVAITIFQQAIAIVIEALLALIARCMKIGRPNFYSLFWDRFVIFSFGDLNENGRQVIGNLFLSINVCVGLIFLFLYFFLYEDLSLSHWIPVSIIIVFFMGIGASFLRMKCAEKIFEK